MKRIWTVDYCLNFVELIIFAKISNRLRKLIKIQMWKKSDLLNRYLIVHKTNCKNWNALSLESTVSNTGREKWLWKFWYCYYQRLVLYLATTTPVVRVVTAVTKIMMISPTVVKKRLALRRKSYIISPLRR